jgi:hypothetical protein
LSELPAPAAEQRLRQAIDAIDEDVARIELWALALSAYTRPAPRYDFGEQSPSAAMT